MPVRVVRAGQVAVTAGAGIFLLSGSAIAPALADPTVPLRNLCNSATTAVVQASALIDSGPSASASVTSLSPTGSSSPSGSPSPTFSPTPSKSPTSTSPSKTPTFSPTKSPTPSKSPTPKPTPKPSPKPGALCVSASIVRHDSLLRPGGTITYSIWVWSTVRSRQVTATISRSGKAIDKPAFTLCPADHLATCSIGSLAAYQAIELLVTDHVRKKATPGEQVSLIVVVQGAAKSPGGELSPAEATVSTVLNQAQSSSPPAIPPGTGVPFPAAVPGMPGAAVTPGSISNLFPVVTPSPTPQSVARQEERKVTKAISTASSLPLDPRLIGGQLAGLAVLAAAITMVVARLSLRSPQPASAPQSGQAPAAPPPPPPPSADNPSPADTSDASAGTDTDSES